MFRNIVLAAALSLAATPGLAVATYEFSFSNDDGSVDGTVSGRLTLPDGDGDRAATSLKVTSAPSELGFILPLDALTSFAAASPTRSRCWAGRSRRRASAPTATRRCRAAAAWGTASRWARTRPSVPR